MYSYDEVFKSTIDYFEGDDLATSVWINKYALHDNENNILEKTPEDMHRRMAKEFARIEKNKFKDPLTEERIFSFFDKFRYIIPQGSIMFGLGNPYQTVSLSNCFVVQSPIDCYNSILDIDKQIVNISKRRGGCGVDLSNLRPRGSPTRNAAKTSTGIISWMERYSHSIREVGQNARRGALMITLSIHHPDILDFVTVKNDPTKVTGANISIRLSQEFLTALMENKDYELRFPINSPIISKMVNAKKVWEAIIHSAWLRAEPGILMWDNILNSVAGCYDEYRPVCVNPCAELSLSELDSCRLMCINLYNFVDNPFTNDAKFDYVHFKSCAEITQRLMDDLVDLESEAIDRILHKIEDDPEPMEMKENEWLMWNEIRKNNDRGRRTGTGITGLADTFAALGIKYGSDESIAKANKIFKTLKLGCYQSSVNMAKEIGHFYQWKKEKEKDCKFLLNINKEDNVLYNEMQKYGRKNVSCLTCAPTGSVSILTQTTSGIEPLFEKVYTRRRKINYDDKESKVDFVDKLGDKWENFTVYHPKLKTWMEISKNKDINQSPWVCANEIDWISRVKLQANIQQHIDHSISSTINLPEKVTEEVISKIYETAFESGCKGITIYRENCRTGVLVKQMEERPKELSCDVHHITVKGVKYAILIGLKENKPYEVFAFSNGALDNSVKTGTIVKKKKNFYKAIFPNDEELSPITALMKEEEEIISRLTSGLLRTGADMNFIVNQLEKVGQKRDINCFATSVSRALKKYIPDGVITDDSCPECGEKLVRISGCKSCKCGYSACV